MITKNELLQATHHGYYIYKRVLSYYYEESLFLARSGRRCELTKNPFNGDRESLQITLVGDVFYFTDDFLPEFKGDAIDFAAHHYQLSGDELLRKINRDMDLHLDRGNEVDAKPEAISEISPFVVFEMPTFSFYNAPITNTKPNKLMTLVDVYNLIKGDAYKERTLKLRSIEDPQAASHFKKTQFDAVTFSGEFSKQSNTALVNHSGLLTLDFDHVENLHLVKRTLFNDLEYHLIIDMMFDSPSGHGFKCILSIDIMRYSHQQYFETLSAYFKKSYNLEVDPSGKDVARACFLPHDPNVWINPMHRI